MSLHIAVDIGGTQIRAACYENDNLSPLKLARVATKDPSSTPLERVISLIGSIWPESAQVTSIGVAVPGPVDAHRGIILSAPNIPGWEQLAMRQVLTDKFHVPVLVGNDANLAAMGEWKFGAGKGHHHLIYLTISTGIGGGIIINDQLLLGNHGLAGELGHVTVMQGGPLCGCGQRGHLEAVASGTAIARWVQKKLSLGETSRLHANQPLTAKMISQAAKEGDALALAALERSGRFIGQALANLLHTFNPSAIIIGGGVSQSGILLLEPIMHSLKEKVMSLQYLDNLELKPAHYGDEAGLMGALALAQESSL